MSIKHSLDFIFWLSRKYGTSRDETSDRPLVGFSPSGGAREREDRDRFSLGLSGAETG